MQAIIEAITADPTLITVFNNAVLDVILSLIHISEPTRRS